MSSFQDAPAILTFCLASTFCQYAFSLPPRATASATISPSTIDNPPAVSGIGTVTANVSYSGRSAYGSGSVFEVSTSATAEGPGLSNLASGGASYRLFLVLDGPTNQTLRGQLQTSIIGSGHANTEPGSFGSVSRGGFYYNIDTSGGGSAGSFHILSQGGIPEVQATGSFASGNAVGNPTITGTMQLSPIVRVNLTTLAGTVVSVSPTDSDWIRWGVVPPATQSASLNNLGGYSDLYNSLLASVRLGITEFGIAGLRFGIDFSAAGVSLDLGYSFQGSVNASFSALTGRANLFRAFVNSSASSSISADADGQASILGVGGSPDSPNFASFAGLAVAGIRFVVEDSAGVDLSQFSLRVDGTGLSIPVVSAVPEPEAVILASMGLLAMVGVAKRRRLRGAGSL